MNEQNAIYLGMPGGEWVAEMNKNLEKTSDVQEQVDVINKDIHESMVVSPAIGFGMNNVIRNQGKATVSPKFTIKGKTLINLLGKDGNCEDVSKFEITGTGALDSNKVFGTNGIKLTVAVGGSYASIRRGVDSVLKNTKYYCISAYLKNGNATTGIRLTLWNADSVPVYELNGDNVTDTTKFTRVFIKIKPSDIRGSIIKANAIVTGSAGQYAYVDGMMLEEITESQYSDPNFQPSQYVDGYTCLANPYFEVRHDNLIRNGNCEEGVAWWKTDNTTNVNYKDGYFTFTDDATENNEGAYQNIDVKPNTDYTVMATIKCGTIDACKLSVILRDDALVDVQLGRQDVLISNTTDTLVTATINTGSYNKLRVGIFGYTGINTGSVYFKEVMMVEGTVSPIEYKTCKIERTVIEGKYTDDDSVVYENGEVTGLLNWKHRRLFGKDFNWQFQIDYAGYKRIFAPIAPQKTAASYKNHILTKYDGKYLNIDVDSTISDTFVMQGLDTIWDGGCYICTTDLDTGWLESIQPNGDEAKAFMNGWKAIISNNLENNRYVAWKSVVDGTIANIYTTLSANTTNSNTVTVVDASKFAVNDIISISDAKSTVGTAKITAISGNIITVNINYTWTSGMYMIKCDSIADTKVLNYCKNNVAFGYEGYNLHYKLANPEPITNINTHVHGDIPSFIDGDNYLFIDNGVILNEIAPITTDVNSAYINAMMGSLLTSKPLKNRVEVISSVYKNDVSDVNWDLRNSIYYDFRGNAVAQLPIANYDNNAIYTVDYKMLVVQAPQIGTLTCDYLYDIVNTINALKDEVNSRQKKDDTLDQMIDLSLYEPFLQSSPSWWLESASSLIMHFNVNLISPKKVQPDITDLSPTIIVLGVTVMNKFELQGIWFEPIISTLKTSIIFKYKTTDPTVIANIKANGVYAYISGIADCRNKI